MLYALSSIRRAMSLTCSNGMPPGSFVFGGGIALRIRVSALVLKPAAVGLRMEPATRENCT